MKLHNTLLDLTTLNPLNPLFKKKREKSNGKNWKKRDTRGWRTKEKKKYTSRSLKISVLTQFGEGSPGDPSGDEGEPD